MASSTSTRRVEPDEAENIGSGRLVVRRRHQGLMEFQ
jgi:hypothetical protein